MSRTATGRRNWAILASVALFALFLLASSPRGWAEAGSVVTLTNTATLSQTPTPMATELPQLDTPKDPRWEPNVFSWIRVTQAPLPSNYFARNVADTKGAGRPYVGGFVPKGDFEYGRVFCSEETNRCYARIDIIDVETYDNTLSVKAHNVAGYRDSETVMITPAVSSRKTVDTRCVPEDNYVIDSKTIPKEFTEPAVSERLICALWVEYVCIHNQLDGARTAADVFFSFVTSEVPIPVLSNVLDAGTGWFPDEVFDAFAAGKLKKPLGGFGSEFEYGAPEYCDDTDDPFPPPSLHRYYTVNGEGIYYNFNGRDEFDVSWYSDARYLFLDLQINDHPAERVALYEEGITYYFDGRKEVALNGSPNDTITLRIWTDEESGREILQNDGLLGYATPVLGASKPSEITFELNTTFGATFTPTPTP